MNGLFSVSKGQAISSIIAPVNGKVIPQSEIPDEAFASGMLGEGIGIIPSDGYFLSPVNGKVIDVTPTRHAYSLLSDDGAEILLHIGIDTVELKGKGFESLVSSGDKIKVGTPIARVDLDVIKNAGYSNVIALIIINTDVLSQLTVFEGECKASRTEIFKFVVDKNKK